MKKIYLATDHAGFDHKNRVRDLLETEEFSSQYTVIDCGAFVMDPKDDYPDFIKKAAAAVSADPTGSKAIIFGGSGQGEAMAANKFPNIQATVYYGGNTEIINLSREHNDANVLSIGARFVNELELEEVVRQWLDAEFGFAERHVRRLKKMRDLEHKPFVDRIRSLLG